MSKVFVEEYDHAYLVHHARNIDDAKQALMDQIPGLNKDVIKRMPARPMWTSELLDDNPHYAVALYFSMGPGGKELYRP